MKSISKLFVTAAVFGAMATGCGVRQEDHDSSLLWKQSRTGDMRYAYLEKKDLTDTFLFGLQVMNTSKFFASALNFNIPSTPVLLERRNNKVAVVSPLMSNSALLSFDVAEKDDGKLELDFGSSGNDLSFQEFVNELGGQSVAGEPNAAWKSRGAPTVLSVQQTPDLVLVDIKYLVSGKATNEVGMVETKSGEVVVRFYLVRRSSLNLAKSPLTVAQGTQDNIGYFGPSLAMEAGVGSPANWPVRKFNLTANNKVTFYLKDFPKEQFENAKKALLDWNQAFDRTTVEVKAATAQIDVADPRYNVIKWIANGDDYLSWAGTAGPTFDDPVTGTVISGGAFINGDYLVAQYRQTHAFSQQVGRFVSAAIGGAVIKPTNGETPIIPFSTIADVSFEEYIKGYYNRTINHEAGHIFGLRHNFKGTIGADAEELTNSVMDYLPRVERAIGGGIGRYDKEAIKWAYKGKRFKGQYGFCTDEDLAKQWNCLQSDVGNPIAYTEAALRDGIAALTVSVAKPKDESDVSSIGSIASNALKMLALKGQMSEAERADAVAKLPSALDAICKAKPVGNLKQADRVKVQANLDLVKAIVKKKLAEDKNAVVAKQYSVLQCVSKP